MAEPAKIKVLQLVEDLSMGGLERVIQGLASGLPARDYDVRVWCLAKGGMIADELRAAGVEVEVLGMGRRCTLPFLFKLRRKLVESRIDILHAHGYTAATIGRAAGLLAGVPVMISHVHSTYWGYTKKQLLIEKALSLVTHKVICCSRAVSEFVTGRENIPVRKTALVYNGAADMRQSADGKMRAERGLSSGDFVVGVTASLNAHKGHSVLFEAMRRVVKTNPEVKAVLAGDGPLRAELEALAKTLGLSSNILFCGTVRDMKSFLAGVDLFLLPSVEREGLPITVLEAMSAGKAVVGTRVGGVPEAVLDGETGLVVEPRDPGALAGAVLTLARDRVMLRRLGQAGRARYEELFRLEKMLFEISKIYHELLGR